MLNRTIMLKLTELQETVDTTKLPAYSSNMLISQEIPAIGYSRFLFPF